MVVVADPGTGTTTYMESRDEIAEKCDHAEATLSEELESHPRRLALRDCHRVQSHEDQLDRQRDDDLHLQVLDFVSDRRHECTADKSAYTIGQLGQANLGRITFEHVECPLRQKTSHGVEDHSGHEHDNEEDGEFSISAEQVEWEERLLWDCEVVDEARNKDDDADDNGCDHGGALPRVRSRTCPGKSNEEDSQT